MAAQASNIKRIIIAAIVSMLFMGIMQFVAGKYLGNEFQTTSGWWGCLLYLYISKVKLN